MQEPTVYLVIGPSAITFDDRGEVIETVDWNTNNQPIWDYASICDHRGAGGADGFAVLHTALSLAEENARLCGFEPGRVTPT